jgi:uncharacterized protein
MSAAPVVNATRSAAIGLIRMYQVFFSPVKSIIFGAASCCRYSPTCSCYAIEAFRRHGVLRACALTGRRLLKCHPWGGTGYDPVPDNHQ